MEINLIMHLGKNRDMKSIFFLLSLFITNLVLAQNDSTRVILSVMDKVHGESVQNVRITIQLNERSIFKVSNQEGKAEFYLPVGSCVIALSHPLFESQNVTKRIVKSDSIQFDVFLVPVRTQNLKEVIVKAPGVPDTVYQSKRLSVSDFEIRQNGDLVLLVYPKQLKKGSELLLYNGQEVTNSFSVPGIAEELIRDYRGNPHVVCKDNVFGIHVMKDKIGIATIEKDYFMKYVAPIVDTNHTKMYFSNFSSVYPAFSYFTYDQLDSTYRKICNIQDDLMMELYRSEYKWVDVRTKIWAKEKEHETGIDAEVWVGATYFTQSIYYKELYAPLFHRNDSLFVFDYHKDKLLTYDAQGDQIDSVAIYHHYFPRSTGWRKQLIQDPVTGEIYAVFDRAGYTYLGRVDTKNGEISEKVRLEFRYIDKISIHNNFVYYVYRPFESVQKKFLYKERLPYTFGAATVPYGIETSMDTGK
jgi:hypothetical protein